MEAVVLAAGRGQRFMPLTKESPKTLLPVANQPILDYVLEALELAGLNRIVIVTGHCGQKIEEYLETTKKRRTAQIECVYAAEHKRGPLFSLLSAEKIMKDDFLLTPADLIMAHGIVTSLLRSHNKRNTMYLAIDCRNSDVAKVPVLCSVTRRGVSGSVLGFGIAKRKSDCEDEKRAFLGTSVGTVICPIEIFDRARSASKYGSTKVVDALNRFIEEGGNGRYVKVGAQHYWFDVDCIETMLAANRFILKKSLMRDKSRGKLYRHKVTFQSEEGGSGSAHLAAEVIGPAIIGEKCTIGAGSRIGPYVSIQDDCVIGSHVRCENAILLSKSRVSNSMTIKDSIVHYQGTINVKKQDSQPTCGDEKDGQR